MSGKQIFPPPPPEAEGGAKRPWCKPRAHLVDFTVTKADGTRTSLSSHFESPPFAPGHTSYSYDPNIS